MVKPSPPSTVKLIHEALPAPVGNGNSLAKVNNIMLADPSKVDPKHIMRPLTGILGTVSNGMERGDTPHPLEDWPQSLRSVPQSILLRPRLSNVSWLVI
jgi:hypothetical protein